MPARGAGRLHPDEATLLGCCGSAAWAAAVAARGPYPDLGALLDAARETWWRLSPEDWREAIAAHPRIGDRPPPGTQEQREQALAEQAPAEVLTALAEANALYEKVFDMTFVVRAAGRTAEQMLEQLRERLANDPVTELGVAAGQQCEITRLRLTERYGAA